MFATIVRHYHTFFYEIDFGGHCTLGALSSPLIVEHGQHCDTAFKPGDKVKLVRGRDKYPSIVGAA